MKTLEIRVSGQVQGVRYRKTTMERARELGLTGTVKNKQDGTVEIIATGAEGQLGELIIWSLEGSSASKVHKVTIHELMPVRNFDSFEVIY